ncbi:hypothetical protein PPL_11550 [Heterostelium album PN500]|uniref:alpha-1,3-mannosyl-glycoprotein 2-beta-N-acetylglucosaminyltransferase n=1 Tax=Heterostelium pallidum (strain ATCC 26659 / Pp 5 / PN500) TaxID=670386 RepID=D3BVF9_HETP5|nr:hypothetical protein PPL_11550 [Heterostelium album PN500]EFA74582.1 hypothetical protein PPL_11550 [Heterostelium album PN500]|eukprot:XP_020426716.1 hypothetical protein PPL_11550 [Heterostelium album PN500]
MRLKFKYIVISLFIFLNIVVNCNSSSSKSNIDIINKDSIKYINENEKVEVFKNNNNNNKVILIMIYKRIDDFVKCLQSIHQSNNSNQYHLIITQSIPTDNNREYYDRVEQLVDLHKPNFQSIQHIETKSTSNQTYGNAYNAFRNLIHGLNYTLRSFPNLDSLIIFEEDIEVSKDLFEFFEKSRELINSDATIRFATSAFFLHTTHPQYDWRVDKPIKRKSIRNQLSLDLLNPNELVKVKLQGQIEFKVLAWMAHHSICRQMISDFYEIEDWVFKNGEHLVENKPNTPKPKLLLDHCDCWNHDRYLELRFKGLNFIGSQSPRCNHIPQSGAGLSNVEDDYGFPVNQIYVTKDKFYITEIKGNPGVWGLMKQYLPKMECPNRVDCYSPDTSEKCGSVRVSTCLNVWGLECVPCSGRNAATLEPECRKKYPKCCGNQCKTKSPFFLSIPSLFNDE